MKTFSDVIDQWESAEALARDVGVKGVTARKWRVRNSIPPEHWPAIVAAAERSGKESITREVLYAIGTGEAA